MVGEPPVQGFWLPGGGVDCRRAALRPGVGWCGCPSGPVIMAACHCGFGSADSALCQSAVLVCAAMACRHSPGGAPAFSKTCRIGLRYGPFCCGPGAAAHLLQAQMASTDRLGGCKPFGVWRLRSRLAGPQQAPGARPSGRRLRANVARLLEPRLQLRPRAAHGMPAATVAGMGRQGGRQTAWLI